MKTWFYAAPLLLLIFLFVSGCDSYEPPATPDDRSLTVGDAEVDPPVMAKAYTDFPPPVIEGFRVTLLGPAPVYGERRTSFTWELAEVDQDEDINHFAVQLAECAGNSFSSPDQFNVNSSTGITGRAGQFRTNEGNAVPPYRFTLNFPLPGVVVGFGEVEVKINENQKSKALYLVPCANTFDINGDVFEDTDGDTVKDAEEIGLSGIKVSLIDDAGTFITSTESAADGNYAFEGILKDAAPYQVRVPKGDNVTLYAERIPTGSTLADGTAIFSTVIGGAVDNGCGIGNECDADIGFTPLTFDISGFVAVDPRNSTTGTGDEIVFAGIPNVTVVLVPRTGSQCGSSGCTQVTAGDGEYLFEDVPSGTYWVSIPFDTPGNTTDFNERLQDFYEFTGTDEDGSAGVQLSVTVGPDSEDNDFSWKLLTDAYTNAFTNSPDFFVFSNNETKWLHDIESACRQFERTGTDAGYAVVYKNQEKETRSILVTDLIDFVNGFEYPELWQFSNSCEMAGALTKPLANGRNNLTELEKLLIKILAAELNFVTDELGLFVNEAGQVVGEDGELIRNMLKYMEDFAINELAGQSATLGKAGTLYPGEASMLDGYNGGGGGGGSGNE